VSSVSVLMGDENGGVSLPPAPSPLLWARLLQWLRTLHLPLPLSLPGPAGPALTYLGRMALHRRMDSIGQREAMASLGPEAVGPLEDPWTNGSLLAQLLAALPLHRTAVKQEEVVDRFFGPSSRLLLTGTTAAVRSRAQALENFRQGLEKLRGLLEGPLPSPHDLLARPDLLWALLARLHRLFARPSPHRGSRGPEKMEQKEEEGGLSTAREGPREDARTPPAPPTPPPGPIAPPEGSWEVRRRASQRERQKARLRRARAMSHSPPRPRPTDRRPWDDRTTTTRDTRDTPLTRNRDTRDDRQSLIRDDRQTSPRDPVSRSSSPSFWQPPDPPPEQVQQALQDLRALPPPTLRQKWSVRAWLAGLGLELRPGEGGLWEGPGAEPLPLGRDRLRSGQLLCLLLLRIEPHAALQARLPLLLLRAPSLAHCRHTLRIVLWLIRIRAGEHIPVCLVSVPEPLLSGQSSAVWGLLWELMQAYSPGPGHLPAPSTPLEGQGQEQAMEAELLAWLRAGQVLGPLLGPLTPRTLRQLVPFLRDGSLACLLAQHLLLLPLHPFPSSSETGIGIGMGYFLRPQSPAQCRHNTHSLLAALGRSRFRSMLPDGGLEEGLLAGDWSASCRLLTAMYAMHNALLQSHASNMPDSGDILPRAHRSWAGLDIVPNGVPAGILSGGGPCLDTLSVRSGSDPVTEEEAASAAADMRQQVEALTIEEDAFSRSQEGSEGPGAIEEPVDPHPNPIPDPSEWRPLSESGLPPRAVRSLLAWLGRQGVRLAVRQDLVLSGQFGDGALLAGLLQRLERRTMPLPGCQLQPRTAAQRVQNLRRVLQHLSSPGSDCGHRGRPRRRADLQLLGACEEGVARGELRDTFLLLREIQRIYS